MTLRTFLKIYAQMCLANEMQLIRINHVPYINKKVYT